MGFLLFFFLKTHPDSERRSSIGLGWIGWARGAAEWPESWEGPGNPKKRRPFEPNAGKVWEGIDVHIYIYMYTHNYIQIHMDRYYLYIYIYIRSEVTGPHMAELIQVSIFYPNLQEDQKLGFNHSWFQWEHVGTHTYWQCTCVPGHKRHCSKSFQRITLW